MPLTITVNNSEQHHIEHQIMVNNLLNTLQPQEMVDNAFGGAAFGKARKAIGTAAKQFKMGRNMPGAGMKTPSMHQSMPYKAGMASKSPAARVGAIGAAGVAGAGAGYAAKKNRKKK